MTSTALGYKVQQIQIGVLAPLDATEYAEERARDLRRIAPDRFQVHVLLIDPGETEETKASLVESWPKVQVLVICYSRPNVPSAETNRYVELHSSLMVLTDYDLPRNVSDRRIFYDVLHAGGLGDVLPRRVYVNRDGYPQSSSYTNTKNPTATTATSTAAPADESYVPPNILDRRDQLEIDDVVLLKPIVERPIDPTNREVRVYYPRSQVHGGGGGCKIITFGDGVVDDRSQWDPSIVHVRSKEPDEVGASYIYEEVLDPEETAHRIRQPERKRDRVAAIWDQQNQNTTGKNNAFPKLDDDDHISYESDLARMDRKIFIVTTASLPWMTGTAVNPLLRAAYLQRGRPTDAVTLVLPWLVQEPDRINVYGEKFHFATMAEQEVHVRDWLKNQAGMPDEADPERGIQIMWYPSRYHSALGSIFPTDDICKLIPDADADVCILEEPEHLNWMKKTGEIWTEKFTHVVGIIHTNYKAYAAAILGGAGGVFAAPMISGLSTLMVRAYCDKVIKLSAALQTYAPEKEVVCNVHGVRADFLQEGKRRGEGPRQDYQVEITGEVEAYFIGKLLWEKGLDRLLRLEYFYKEVTGEYFPIDIVGDGPHRGDIEKAFHNTGTATSLVRKFLSKESSGVDSSKGGSTTMASKEANISDVVPAAPATPSNGKIPAQFHGRQDHAEFCKKYKVIVNPSITEVLCTTTAEALAMGKFAIIPRHPSNGFFEQFPNCLIYETDVDFVNNLVYALTHNPEPLTEELSYIFTWEAATGRLIASSAVTMGESRAKTHKVHADKRIARMYNTLGKGGDVFRMVFGGGNRQSSFEDSESQ